MILVYPLLIWADSRPCATSQYCADDTSCRKDQAFTIKGQLCVQAYAMAEQTGAIVCSFQQGITKSHLLVVPSRKADGIEYLRCSAVPVAYSCDRSP